MPVPRLNISRYKPSENERKFHKLMDALFDMGYDVHNTQDIIDIIETKELNISPSDYPYGSFEEFKKHKNNREFEMATLEDMMMKIPSIPIPNCIPPKEEIQAGVIIRSLLRLGYDIEDERDAVKIIEYEGIKKFNFDYPYGSFETFKQHVLTGEFDFDIEKDIKFGTKEDHERLEKAVEKGKLWVTY